MSVSEREIIRELDRLLEPERFADYSPNGLQVPGERPVRTVVSAVSAQVELFVRARELAADLVLVHHGLFWGAGAQVIDRELRGRLQILLASGMGLAAYHLPLDAHPVLGNNALLVEGLGAADGGPFAEHRGAAIGRIAVFDGEGVPAPELFERVRGLTSRDPLVFAAGPERVRRLGVVSGAASDHLRDAVELGLDGLLTGEPAERVMAQAREAGVHFIAAGHYATETFGVRRVGELVAERFGVAHLFVDIPNPV